jgi:hypothetical protein
MNPAVLLLWGASCVALLCRNNSIRLFFENAAIEQGDTGIKINF